MSLQGVTNRRSRSRWRLLVCVLSGLAPCMFVLLPALGALPLLASSRVPAAASSITVTYFSSVDGAALEYLEYLPAGYNPGAAYPLVVLLHGSGGNLRQYDTDAWHSAADSHGYILATIHARTIPGYGASRQTFYIDGALVPGAQDVLDALPAAKARHLIDPTRIYIAGYSMGGVGALNIATQNPGVFAAAAPGTSITDMFQENAYASALATPSFAALLGGAPGTSAAVDSRWYQNSPRFLLPNLMHTPLRVVHGISDTVIPNATNIWPYMQSRHGVDTPGFVDSRGRAPTLAELRSQWPNSYYAEYDWPAADHGGTSLQWLPEEALTFFDAHVAVTNPLSVAFTTYDDRHTRAYWLQMDLVQPWSAASALAYVTRDPPLNTARLQVTGALTLTLDNAAMDLQASAPLTLVVASTNGAYPAGNLALVLDGNWLATYSVSRDGAALAVDAYMLEPQRFTLVRNTLDLTHTYVIRPDALPPRVYMPSVQR